MLNSKDVEVKIIPGEILLTDGLDDLFSMEVLSFEGSTCVSQDKIY